jgi:hypothetical protein
MAKIQQPVQNKLRMNYSEGIVTKHEKLRLDYQAPSFT